MEFEHLKPQDRIKEALLKYQEPEFARKAIGMNRFTFKRIANRWDIPLDIGKQYAQMQTIESKIFSEINVEHQRRQT